jgi:hypothetical protein
MFYSMKKLRVLAERWRIHFNTVRPPLLTGATDRHQIRLLKLLTQSQRLGPYLDGLRLW